MGSMPSTSEGPNVILDNQIYQCNGEFSEKENNLHHSMLPENEGDDSIGMSHDMGMSESQRLKKSKGKSEDSEKDEISRAAAIRAWKSEASLKKAWKSSKDILNYAMHKGDSALIQAVSKVRNFLYQDMRKQKTDKN